MTKFRTMTIDEFDQYLLQTKFNRIVNIIQNHHTTVPSYANFSGDNHQKLLEGMGRYHVVERGFSQIAQNLTTFPDGMIALCRPLETIPAGIKGANQAGICIEHLGNFDTGKDQMTAEHRETIVKINALLCREFRLPPSTETIVYHHWYDLKSGIRTDGSGTTKSCPGTAFFGGNSVAAARSTFIPEIIGVLKGMVVPASATALRSAVVNASSLNVRSGRGTDMPVLKSLGRGIMVQVYEEADGWCRVHPSEQHWVYDKYLR